MKPDIQCKNWYSPRPSTSWNRNRILHGGWCSGDSSKVQVSSESFQQLQRCGRLLNWFIQQFVLRTIRDVHYISSKHFWL